MEAAASPTSTLHYHPRITQKKHREGKQVTKENRPITTRIRVRKLKFFKKEKNRDSKLSVYRTEAKKRKGSKSPDAVVSRGERERKRAYSSWRQG
jgi:hypothetical protein